MSSGPELQTTLDGGHRGVGALLRFLASLKLTIALILLLAAAAGYAVFLEATRGREWAQWYVYGRGWYLGLLGVLAANIAAAAWSRYCRPTIRPALLIAPIGLLVLLAGSIQTLVQGIEGRLILWKGETTDTVMLADRSQLMLLSPRGNQVETAELGFSPGPADWPGGQALDFGQVNGVGIKVLRFYRHALYEPEWVADAGGMAEPAIQLAVSDARRRASGNHWYVPLLFSGPFPGEELHFSINRASVPLMRDDFLQPPTVQPGSRGILSVHYQDRVYPIRVDGNTGKKIPVGDSPLTVEIVDYYANARSEKDQFTSEGDEPKNPMLRLRVQMPDRKEPLMEIAYANQPFVNYESIRKQKCPVKFWYHHPATKAVAGAEFLQAPDGTLYCRAGDGKAYQHRGQVKEGEKITVSPECQITLLRHIPHARQQGSFTPIGPAAAGQTSMAAEAAALVELTTGGKIEQFWLRRNDAQLGVRKLDGLDKPLVVTFGYERRPLGFSVKLAEFHKESKPGSAGDASGTSRVLLAQGKQKIDDVSADKPLRDISTSRPLRFGTFTFYQSGFQQSPNGAELSVLRVTSDPGRLLKYSGAAMICGGILFALALRTLTRRPMPPSPSPAQSAEGGDDPERSDQPGPVS